MFLIKIKKSFSIITNQTLNLKHFMSFQKKINLKISKKNKI